MEEDDQQASCGHERSYKDSEEILQSSPGYRRDDGATFERLQQNDGKSNVSGSPNSKTQDKSIHGLSAGHLETSSVEHLEDPHRTVEIKSAEQSVVRPERAALPGTDNERGRARIRPDIVSKAETEVKEPQGRPEKEGLKQSLPSGREPTDQRPKGSAPRRPELSRLWKAVLIALEPSGKPQQEQKQTVPEIRQDASKSEANIYRAHLLDSAERYSNLSHASAVTTRHFWSSRIVLYDICDAQQSGTSVPRVLWPEACSAPTYEEFHNALRFTPAQCYLRMIFVEDLNPALIDYLGASFQIPPGVFEKHLNGSGYTRESLKGKTHARWLNHSSSPDCSSVTWFRPVIPLLPATSGFRSQLLDSGGPKVSCMLEGCEKDHTLRTTANILRRNVRLCPSPGAYHKDSETDYPIAWEERVTMFTRRIDGCKFAIVLLDPLPFTRVDSSIDHDQQKDITRQKLEIVRVNAPSARESQARSTKSWAEQQRPLPTPAANVQSLNLSHTSSLNLAINTPLPSAGLLDTLPSSSAKNPAGVTFLESSVDAETSRARVTGSAVDTTRAISSTTGPRQRNTRLAVKRISNWDAKGPASPNRPAPKTTEGIDTDQAKSVRAVEPQAHDYDRVIPYHPIKAGSSSSAILGDGFTTLDMPAYIERLHIPFSVIGEFEAALQPTGKGKETILDPLQILFRVIHDDCHNLTDVIRDSLHRIRQDTLNEDMMQQRVTYWRKLLHRFNSSLAEVDQQLRSFVNFRNDKELFYLAGNQRTELASEKLARDTSQTLAKCLDLVERSSTALLTEMQIVDSRRSIAEAESISKLTELAFVFIPLSFVASLFSMQVQELGDGVPLYVFTLAAIATVFIAYAMRLSIRSSRLIDYKTRILDEIRIESHVPHNQPLPTRAVMIWLHTTISRFLSKTSAKVVVVVFPFLLVGALIAALLSPIALLWLRDIDRGFTIVITILVLSANAIVFIPLAKFGYRALEISPIDIIRDVRRWRRENQKKKTKSQKQARFLDPEA